MEKVEVAPYAGKFETGAIAPAVRHMVFIDGLRGAAALYVVLQHAVQNGFFGMNVPHWLTFLGWGHDAVTVFIVISGYCLALPVQRSGRTLKAGARRFYGRRAFRILPPYYAALALAILAEVFVSPAGHHWAPVSDPLFGRALLLHLLLLHNWFPSVEFAFDGPLWSVAVECQIYLLFPLLVIFWRRFGSGWLLAGSFVLAHALFLLTHHHGSANYLFEFVVGMLAADFATRKDRVKHLQWAFYLCVAAFLLYPDKSSATCDVFVGIGAGSLMALCSHRFWARPLLSFAPLAWLGTFSYSIYLVHGIVMIGYLDYVRMHGGTSVTHPSVGYSLLAMLVFVVVPVALAAAYVFHVWIERPFMTMHKVIVAAPVPGLAAAALEQR